MKRRSSSEKNAKDDVAVLVNKVESHDSLMVADIAEGFGVDANLRNLAVSAAGRRGPVVRSFHGISYQAITVSRAGNILDGGGSDEGY